MLDMKIQVCEGLEKIMNGANLKLELKYLEEEDGPLDRRVDGKTGAIMVHPARYPAVRLTLDPVQCLHCRPNQTMHWYRTHGPLSACPYLLLAMSALTTEDPAQDTAPPSIDTQLQQLHHNADGIQQMQVTTPATPNDSGRKRE